MSADTGYVILGVLIYIALILTLLTFMELANRIERGRP